MSPPTTIGRSRVTNLHALNELPITFVIKSMTYEQVFSKYVLQLLENDAKVDKYLITKALKTNFAAKS